MNYKKLWNAYNKYNYYNFKRDDINSLYEQHILKLYHQQTGKRTKKLDKALSIFTKEQVEEIQKPYMVILTERLEKRKKIKKYMKTLLEEYAKTHSVISSNNMYLLKTSDGGDYHTQGFGCNKYAKGSLQEPKMLLDLFGYKTEINEMLGERTDQWGIRYNTYELWANISPFDYYCFREQGNFISVLNWAVLCWRNGVNPKVYFPFLSDEDYEKSLVLWRDNSYTITRDNCMLEVSMEDIKK